MISLKTQLLFLHCMNWKLGREAYLAADMVQEWDSAMVHPGPCMYGVFVLLKLADNMPFPIDKCLFVHQLC